MTAVLSLLAAAMNAAMTNGTDDDALPRVVAAASEAAMRNGTDNYALLCVLPAAMEAVMTNGTDDDALPRVPATDIAIATTSAVGGWGMGNSCGFYFNFLGGEEGGGDE